MIDNGIQGWMHVEELEFLFSQASSMSSIVEIGSWKGRTTKALLDTGNIVYAIDTFDGSQDPNDGTYLMAKVEDIFEEFKKNTFEYRNLRVIRMESQQAALLFEDHSVDMIFIDAEHTYQAVLDDINAWLPKAKKLICGHDYSDNWPSVKKAVNERFGDQFKIFDRIWYVNLGVL